VDCASTTIFILSIRKARVNTKFTIRVVGRKLFFCGQTMVSEKKEPYEETQTLETKKSAIC
jgi:hypothetical protein